MTNEPDDTKADTDADTDAGVGVGEAVFPFEWESRYRPFFVLIGVWPSNSRVTVGAGRLTARYGPWTCDTTLDNIREVCVTGPYRGYRAIGARGSMVDRGLTFGTTTAGGVCLLFHEPVTGLDPFGRMRHPGLTVTVADRDRLVASLSRRGTAPR